ncbi:hypothetical protein [Lysobacter enzymogenes]|uniref:hypothetical protein n=1 Tax=Lysobacter enzymogenes TaxID=69 RepID=UPI0019D2AFF8|nr:hypothetical protein [Lysobacter enzymogenes]
MFARQLLLALALGAAAAGGAHASYPAPGALVVLDEEGGPNQRGALYAIEPVSGYRRVLTDFGNGIQGPVAAKPNGLARVSTGLWGGDDRWIVTDASGGTDNRGAVYEVDLSNGARTTVADFGDASRGPLGRQPEGVIYVAPVLLGPLSGFFVLDRRAGTDGRAAIFKLESNGRRSVFSDLGDGRGARAAQAVAFAWRPGALGLGGKLLVTDMTTGTNGHGALLTVDPINKNRTVLSDFGDVLQGWVDARRESAPNSVIAGNDGSIYVLVTGGGTDRRGALVKVDPSSGYRNLVSDLGVDSQGPLGSLPVAIRWSKDQQTIYVVDANGGTDARGTVLQVDPATGARRTVSDFGLTGYGPLGQSPRAIDVN